MTHILFLEINTVEETFVSSRLAFIKWLKNAGKAVILAQRQVNRS